MSTVRSGLLSGGFDRLQASLADLDPQGEPARALRTLVERGLDRLPLPGSKDTLQRWQALAAVGARDLALAKLYEGHTDALAILAELGHSMPSDGGGLTYGVWAAEAPGARVLIDHGQATDGRLVKLSGVKCWCSGAADVSHGLLTAWSGDDRQTGPQLVRVAMQQPGVATRAGNWHAVGMRRSASIDVVFDGALAEPIGNAGDYLQRPGFWQGGAGIAACWFGAAQALATALRQTLQQAARPGRDAFRLAALGRIDIALQGTAAILREAARWIAAHPCENAHAVALRARMSAEATSRVVLDEAGRALGAAAFCRDAHFAQLAADLPVFVRQTHAEADLQALGECLVAAPQPPWTL